LTLIKAYAGGTFTIRQRRRGWGQRAAVENAVWAIPGVIKVESNLHIV